jgi:hypothetical protein
MKTIHTFEYFTRSTAYKLLALAPNNWYSFQRNTQDVKTLQWNVYSCLFKEALKNQLIGWGLRWCNPLNVVNCISLQVMHISCMIICIDSLKTSFYISEMLFCKRRIFWYIDRKLHHLGRKCTDICQSYYQS